MPTLNPDLHGNVPDKAPVALLLIDVINDLEFPEGEQLLRFARPMAERIENGQLQAGSPDTVLAQARRSHEEVGAGILEVTFSPMGRERTLRAIELFGTAVLPRLREL